MIDLLAECTHAMRAAPLRTALTILAIGVGSAAIVATSSIADSLRASVASKFGRLGSSGLRVLPADPTRRELNDADLQVVRELRHVAGISLEREISLRIGSPDSRSEMDVRVVGASEEFASVHSVEIAAGRLLRESDRRFTERVAVLGASAAEELFGQAPSVGRRVRILGATFGVVGVAAPLRSRKAGRDDAFVLVPRETLRSLAGRDERVEIAVLADAPENLADLSDAIRDSLRRLHGLRSSDRDDFRVETQASLAAAADTMVSVLTVAMLMSCLLALSVAGIGVMNVMLIAVKERTREIGLRLAVGASRRQITVQFVTEAATLGVTGAVSGLAAGVAAAAWIAKGMDSALSVPAWGVACGVLAATGTAMVSGIVPAVRASRLTPAAALAADEMSSWPSSEEPTSLRLGSHR